MIKKYYIGARHIAQAILNGNNAPCMHFDMEDAINEAKDKIRDDNAEICVIVEIKAIVRRDRPPVTVERV